MDMTGFAIDMTNFGLGATAVVTAVGIAFAAKLAIGLLRGR